MLTDKQKQEVDNAIYEQVQENLDDLSVFEDYWHGITCSDGIVLDINIYDSEVYGTPEHMLPRRVTGLICAVYFVDKDLNTIFSNPIEFESKHLDGIDPQTNAQKEVDAIETEDQDREFLDSLEH